MSDHRPHGKTLMLDEGAAARLWLAYDGRDDLKALAKIFPKTARAKLHVVGNAVVPVHGPLPLARYEAACRAIAEAKRADEVLHILDEAEAMRAAVEIRLKAERRLGEIIKAQKETIGLATGGQPYQQSTGSQRAPVERRPTLA